MQNQATSIASPPEVSELSHVPLLDITSIWQGSTTDRQSLALQLDWAFRHIGFVIITGHNISLNLIERLQRVTRAFFDLPLDEKMKCWVGKKNGNVGYTPIEALTLAKTYGDALPPDLNETINLGPIAKSDAPYYRTAMGQRFFPDNRWPEDEDFRQVWTEYYYAASDLVANLMRICALALHLPEDYFADKFDRQISHLVARNYPEQLKAPRPGQLRAAAHRDFGGLTLLLPEDKPGGLQVMGKEGQWHTVHPPANSFVINLGDMIAQWTNDAWVSTLHRVVNPPQQAVETRRLLIAFFSTPNYDTVIECLPTCKPDKPARYQPVTAGVWYACKLKQLGLTK